MGDRDLLEKTGLAGLSFDGRAVDDEVTEVSEDLLRAVLRGDEVKEGRGIVDELRSGVRFGCERTRQEECTVVQVLPVTKTSCERTRKRNGMLVLTPGFSNISAFLRRNEGIKANLGS